MMPAGKRWIVLSLVFRMFKAYASPDESLASGNAILNLVPPFSSAMEASLSLKTFAYIYYEGGVLLPVSAMAPNSASGIFAPLESVKKAYAGISGKLPEIFLQNPVWLMVGFHDYSAWQGTVLSIFSDQPELMEVIIVAEKKPKISYKENALEQFHLFSSSFRADYILPPLAGGGDVAVFIRLKRVRTGVTDIQLSKISEFTKRSVISGIQYSVALAVVIFAVIMSFVFLNIRGKGNKFVSFYLSAYSLVFGVLTIFSGSLSPLGLNSPELLFVLNIISCFYPLNIYLLSVIWNNSRTVQLVSILVLLSISFILCSLVWAKEYSLSEAGMYLLLFATSTALLRPAFRDLFFEASFKKYYLVIYVSHASISLFLFAATFFSELFSFGHRSAILWILLLCTMLIASFASIVSYLKWGAARNRVSYTLKQEGEKLTREKREFIKSVASLLRSPLNRMVSLLEDQEGTWQGSGRVIDIALAKNEAVYLLNIVSNIVSYVNLKDGSINLTSEHFSLAASVNSAIQLVGYFTSSNKLRFDQSIPAIDLINDIKTVQQVLYNTIYRSAITDSVSQVSVKASVQGANVFLSISDDGHATEGSVFFAGSPGVVWGDAEEGPNNETDMDLALTARLVTLIGGKFKYIKSASSNIYSFEFPLSYRFPEQETTSESMGTEIVTSRFRHAALSKKDQPGIKAERIALREQSGSSVPFSVLLVDDEPVSLFTLKRRIETAGWIVSPKISSWQALEALKGGLSCDVIIVDALMPEMSGFEFTKKIREYYPREKLPVIVLIDAGRPEEIDEVFKSGADDYLVRPVGGVELLSKVKTHADLARSVRREFEQRDKMAEIDKLKTLGWLTAGVAHEINTPNNSVLRNVPILKEIWTELSPVLEKLYLAEGEFNIQGFSVKDLRNEIPEMYNDLYMGAQHIRKIVEDLKEYARGPRMEGQVPVDVNQAVQYAIRLLKHSIAVCTKKFTSAFASGLPPVMGDKLKLTQVVVNILENALQSLPSANSAVSVETFFERPGNTEFPDGQIGIRISDQGVGMSPDVLASVFNPFFTTKREKGGTGLGMPVVAGIVREFEGTISIESDPDKGTVVTVMFPVHRESVPEK